MPLHSSALAPSVRHVTAPRATTRVVPTRSQRLRALPGIAWLLLTLTAGCGEPPVPSRDPNQAQAQVQAQTETIVVYLVRHAERAEDGTSDPPLSAEGQVRAALVARMLADAGVREVHASDYIRTRETARPSAEAVGAEVRVYDPRDPTALVRYIQGRGGRHLVVGHSNTIPELVEALGGEGGAPIDEMEYDRFYVLAIGPASTTSVLLRFGASFAP